MSKVLMKKTYNFLNRNLQDDGQLFLVHFQEEWHSQIALYTKNRKVSGSNLTNALCQTLGPNLIMTLPVDFGQHLK